MVKEMPKSLVQAHLKGCADRLSVASEEDNPQVVQDHLDEVRAILRQVQRSNWGYSFGWPQPTKGGSDV